MGYCTIKLEAEFKMAVSKPVKTTNLRFQISYHSEIITLKSRTYVFEIQLTIQRDYIYIYMALV
jgi:UDP-3-O-acyl-N-acetylglucosamine deacetylase